MIKSQQNSPLAHRLKVSNSVLFMSFAKTVGSSRENGLTVTKYHQTLKPKLACAFLFFY